MRGGAAVEEEVDVNELEHAFGSEGGAVVVEFAGVVCFCVCDGLTRHLHAAFGECLGVAEVLEFFGVFGAAVHDT